MQKYDLKKTHEKNIIVSLWICTLHILKQSSGFWWVRLF